MQVVTPFLPGFSTTLCGRAAVQKIVSDHVRTMQRASCCQLSCMFRDLRPSALLAPAAYGVHSQRCIFSLEVTFWAFLAQGAHGAMLPKGSCQCIVTWHKPAPC